MKNHHCVGLPASGLGKIGPSVARVGSPRPVVACSRAAAVLRQDPLRRSPRRQGRRDRSRVPAFPRSLVPSFPRVLLEGRFLLLPCSSFCSLSGVAAAHAYDVLMARDPARIRLARELRASGRSYGNVAAKLGCGRTEAYRLANMPDTTAPAPRPLPTSKLSWKERVARMIG